MHNGDYNNRNPNQHHHRHSYDPTPQRGINRPRNNVAWNQRGFVNRQDNVNNWNPRRDNQWGLSEDPQSWENGQQHMNDRIHPSENRLSRPEFQPSYHDYQTSFDDWNAIAPGMHEWRRNNERLPPGTPNEMVWNNTQEEYTRHLHTRSYSDGRKRQRSRSAERGDTLYMEYRELDASWNQQTERPSFKKPRIAERNVFHQGWERQRQPLPPQSFPRRQTVSMSSASAPYSNPAPTKGVYTRKQGNSDSVAPQPAHFNKAPNSRATFPRQFPIRYDIPSNIEDNRLYERPLSNYPVRRERTWGPSIPNPPIVDEYLPLENPTRNPTRYMADTKPFSPPRAPRAMSKNIKTAFLRESDPLPAQGFVESNPRSPTLQFMPNESQQRSLPTEEQSQDLPSVTPALTEDIVQNGDDIACPYPCHDDTPSTSQNPEAAESATCSETPLNSQPLSEKGTTTNSEEPFEFITLVGEGSYGTVSKARDRQNGRLVALKKIRTESQRNGFPVTALREIKILQSLHHENVVQLREMVVRKGAIFLSFEYLEHDLVGLLRQKVFELKVEHMKSFTQQLLRGLEYLHSRGILHRDLKAANLLVTRQGALKIGDFGLARSYNKRKHADYTNHVCTLLYRAPELMLGETIYGPEIDIWSAGCIFMELFLKKVLFEGRDDIDQLGLIYSTLGSPSGTYAQCLLHKPWYSLMDLTKFENCFRAKYASIISADALDFAETLLDLDGTKRPSATSALGHPYFQSMPHAAKPDLSSLTDDYHEYDERSNRKGRESQAK